MFYSLRATALSYLGSLRSIKVAIANAPIIASQLGIDKRTMRLDDILRVDINTPAQACRFFALIQPMNKLLYCPMQ